VPGDHTFSGSSQTVGVQVNSIVNTFTGDRTQVQAWVVDPTTRGDPSGLYQSHQFNLENPQNHRDTLSVQPRAGQDWLTALFDWHPDATDIATRHLCIMANVFVDGIEGASKGGPDVLNPCTDQHQAQANINVVAAAAPGPHGPRSAQFSFFVPGPSALMKAEETIVRAVAVPQDQRLSPVIQEHLLRQPFVDLVDGEQTPEADEPSCCLTEPRERIRLRGGGRLVLTHSDGRAEVHPAKAPPDRVGIRHENELSEKHALTLRPGTSIPLRLEVEIAQADPGAVHELDVVETLLDGTVVGGLRVIFLLGFDWWEACC
jgi:hypothetical protein